MKNKIITGQIADATGHTDFEGSIDEAVARIMDLVQTQGKFPYINGEPFVFENFSKSEENRLRTTLDSAEEPSFVLTGTLQGGITK